MIIIDFPGGEQSADRLRVRVPNAERAFWADDRADERSDPEEQHDLNKVRVRA